MKVKTLFTAMMLTGLFLSASQILAQEGGQAEVMKKWQEAITPGAAHQEFAKLAGNWKAAVTTYMGPQEAKAEATAQLEMVLGGRYLKSSFKGNMMGMPFEGLQLDAFDNVTKEYVSAWIDNFGTGIMLLKGKKDEKTGEIVYLGTSADPMTGKMVTTKIVNKVIDNDHTTSTMFMVENGQDVKNMFIEYTREK